MAAVVLVAQLVMVPVALFTGLLCDRWGRKWVFAIGFIVLPLRIFLYSLARSPEIFDRVADIGWDSERASTG